MIRIIVLLLLVTGCTTTPEIKPISRSEFRKQKLTGCVTHFLHEDVNPKMSLGICKAIYKRWK